MALSTAVGKNNAATGWATPAAYAALYTTVPAGSAGTEVTGGTPAYARKALVWGTPTAGVTTATATFDVPAGTTVAGAGVLTAVTGGTFIEGGAVTSQAFATQGTYVLTITYTQS